MTQKNHDSSTGYQGIVENGGRLYQGIISFYNSFPPGTRFFLVIIAITASFGAFFPVIKLLFMQGSLLHAKYECDQKLTDSTHAESTLKICEYVLKNEPNNADALKNAGRASLMTWDSDWYDSQKESLISKTEDYFNRAYQPHTANPEAAFYYEFIKDFRGLVLTKKPACKFVKDSYRESIRLYNSEKYKIQEKDFPILVELGHFLINRDREFQQAINLFDRIPKTDTKFYRDILSTKAIARTQQGNFEGARGFFQEALEVEKRLSKSPNEKSYKINNDLASTYAQSALSEPNIQVKNSYYDKAISIYKQTTQPNVAHKNYHAWRNLGFLFYLKGEYSQAITAFDTALSFENKGVKTIDAIDSSRKKFIYGYREKAINNAAISSGKPNDNNSLENLLKDNRIFSGYFITHEGNEDPFFEVQHGKFYNCVK